MNCGLIGKSLWECSVGLGTSYIFLRWLGAFDKCFQKYSLNFQVISSLRFTLSSFFLIALSALFPSFPHPARTAYWFDILIPLGPMTNIDFILNGTIACHQTYFFFHIKMTFDWLIWHWKATLLGYDQYTCILCSLSFSVRLH